jgi:transcriptional regulator with XRE-family HTH domain
VFPHRTSQHKGRHPCNRGLATLSQPCDAYRQRRDWSQTYLADRLGVTRATVAKYENGESEPGTYLIAKLHEQLGIRLEAFAKPPPKRQTIEEPLSEYLVDDEVDAAVEEAVRGPDRRQQDRRAL